MDETTKPAGVGPRKRIWLQVVLVFLLAGLAQGIGLVAAYTARCKPGQGNDFCGTGSLAAVLVGFLAAVIVLIAGLVIVFVRRKSSGDGAGPGAGRVVAAVFGAIVLVPCVWMIVGGWPRNNSDVILWIGIVAGVGLIVAAFLRRGRAKEER